MTSGTPGAPGKPDGTVTDGTVADGTVAGEGPPAAENRPAAEDAPGAEDASGAEDAPASGDAPDAAPAPGRRKRRFLFTTSTARPEGGGRAAPRDAPAPARQWPLLTVLTLAGLGLLVVGTDPFPQAFRVGAMLIGAALLVGAALRWAVPSVGMLAVRSRFTDLITYGVMGGLIVFLALMVQPGPWLKIPFLEEVLHLTVT